MAKTDPGFLGN
ncbi:hypothetical protein CP03DC29_0950A, partial [Chlamydia psittaci 03DC29]